MSGIVIKDIRKTYKLADSEHTVFDGLSLELDTSSINVVIGTSGCGKTTLLRILSGIEKPDSGTMQIQDGIKIGVMFQEARLMPWLDCEKNIAFGSRYSRDDPKIAELIETVGLKGFEHAYPDQLSGGMQQRAALARTLAQDSDFILMDEPFAALDYFTRRAMQNELIRIQSKEKTGILFVTHNVDEAMVIGDSIIILSDGKAQQLCTLPGARPRDMLSEPYISIKRRILDAYGQTP
jgi:sulfonate transport system ATP-binding protein